MPPLAGAAIDDGANRMVMCAALVGVLRHIAAVDGRSPYTAVTAWSGARQPHTRSFETTY